MPAKIREYPASGLTVTYDVRRCIRAHECVHGLPSVFDTSRRVWIDATQASPDAIAAVVTHCPTGALHFQRTDGGANEQLPERNEIRVMPDGPLYLRGELEIHTADGVIRETRAALCRCGASSNKPFCDSSHERVEFHHAPDARPAEATVDSASGLVRVRPQRNGPCLVEGAFAVVDRDGRLLARLGPQALLCRCGHSANKPFCDGSHQRVEFTAA